MSKILRSNYYTNVVFCLKKFIDGDLCLGGHYIKLSNDNKVIFFYKFLSLMTADEISNSSIDYKIRYFTDLILKTEPHNVEVILSMGESCLKLERYSEGEKCFRKAIDYNNYLFEAWLGMGDSFKHQKKYYEAIDSYNSALYIDSINLDAIYSLGYCLLQIGDFSEAKKVFKNYIGLDPDGLSAHKLLITIDFLLGDYESAYDNLILLDNDQKISALLWAINSAEFHQNYHTCLTILKCLIVMDKNNVLYYRFQSICYENVGYFIEAANAYEKYLGMLDAESPLNIDTRNKINIVSLYKRLKKYSKAIKVAQEAELTNTSEDYFKYVLFSLYFLEGLKDKAYLYLKGLPKGERLASLNILLEDCIRWKRYEDIDTISNQILDIYSSGLFTHFSKLLVLINNISKSNFDLTNVRALIIKISDTGHKDPCSEGALVYKLSDVWETISDLSDLDRIISKIEDLKLDYVSYILKATKFVSLWKIDEKLAFDFYIKNSKIKNLIPAYNRKIKRYALEKVQKIVNDNRRYDKVNKLLKDIYDNFVFQECNEIIEKCDLYEMDDLVICPYKIKDTTEDINLGIVLVKRCSSLNIDEQSKIQNKTNLTQEHIKYDILYYSFDGSNSILDYTRSFIGEKTDTDSSSLHSKILSNYYNIIS